jgi:hypothetical protein
MTRVTEHTARADFWRSWLCRKLPAELASEVSAISEREHALTVFASSAAWSARLRYALAELEGEMRAAAPGLMSIAVRVRPPA